MGRLSYFLLVVPAFLFTFCGNNAYTPKPSGYMRIDFPEKAFNTYAEKLPYRFDYPVYAIIKPDSMSNAEPYWINIEFPGYNGKIHVSYKKLKGNADLYIEDARKMAYKHTFKADAINESIIEDSVLDKYGILYDIAGNTASSVQFFITDNKKHFLRGALYFNAQPNKDSLAPVIEFFRYDVIKFIESLHWN